MNELIGKLAAIDPSTRVTVGMALVCVGIVGFILTLSKVRDWPARQPAEKRHKRAQRWYGIRAGQESARVMLARLAREREQWAQPAGVPLAISARAWLDDAPTWPQPRIG